MGRRRRGEGGELCVCISVGLGVVSGICAFDGGVGGCLGSWFRVRGEGMGWDGRVGWGSCIWLCGGYALFWMMGGG